MPNGRVKFYDPKKGFGFINNTTDPSVDAIYFNSAVLPHGVDDIPKGTRVEYSEAVTSRGAQVLKLKILDPIQSVAKARRRDPEDMICVIEDVINLLDGVSTVLRTKGKYPSDKELKKVANLLEATAKDFMV